MRSIARVALVAFCVTLCCAIVQSGPIVPNQSRIIGSIVSYSILDSRLLDIAPIQPLFRLGVLIESVEDVEAYPNLLRDTVGSVVDVLSKVELHPCLFGNRVQMEVRIAGDEAGQSVWLQADTLVVLGSDPMTQTPSFCVEAEP